MLQSITTNPLFTRLTRRGISLQPTVWIAVGSMLFSMTVGTAVGLISNKLPGTYALGSLVTAAPLYLLYMLYSPVIAAFTATVVGNDVHSEDYTMLKLTLITPQQVVRGYVSASLYRQRTLHAAALGLSFIGMFQSLGMILSILSMQPAIPFGITSIATVLVLSVLTILRIAGLAFLASIVGVTLSLLWRQRGLAIIAAAAVMLTIVITGFLLSLALPTVTITAYRSMGIDLKPGIVSAINWGYGIVSTTLVYLLAWGAMRLARRWV